MKKLSVLIILILNAIYALSQSPQEIISNVFKAQQALKSVSYALVRTDTLVTGTTRTMTGKCMLMIDKTDPVFGFKFWSKTDIDDIEMVYDWHIGYETNPKEKTYTLINHPSNQVLYSGPGRIILTDLIKLDTSKTQNFKINQDTRFYYLTLLYPDIKEYSVIKRSKTLKISKKTMLPESVRQHQETLGRVQDLFYQAKDVDINNASFSYDFSSPDFIKEYKQRIISSVGRPVMTLKDKEAPVFELSSFDSKIIKSSEMRGKLVLLDFWEVWCGPCLESMPKVQHLYDTYKEKGLLVYGITTEVKQLQPAKQLIKSRGIRFPMLIGNEQLKKDYKMNAIPLYLLIDKNGKVIFVSEGYSDSLEATIQANLI